MHLGLLAISFLLVAFGQPAWVRGFGVLSGAVGFALFWKAMLCFPSRRDRFWLSVIWFTSVQAVQLSWMATLDYMGPLILAIYAFLILAMGIQFGLLSFFFNANRGYSSLAIAGCWTLFEWSRLFFLCGFTWNPVGLALAGSSYSLQMASLFGIFGLTFWVILVNVSALRAIVQPTLSRASVWALLAIFPYGFGWIHQQWIEESIAISHTLRVALLQTAIFPEQKEVLFIQGKKYIPPVNQWARLVDLFDPREKVDLIVLPEAALPSGAHTALYDFAKVRHFFPEMAFPPFEKPYAIFMNGSWKVSNAFLLQALANQHEAHVIAGLEDQDFAGRYNAAFHFLPKRSLYDRYEKRILVPVGEYVPLGHWRKMARFIAEQFGIYGSFDAGKKAKVFQGPLPMGISICLEETFSEIIRELRVAGAQLFVNLTNDAWFPRSKLPRQHLDHGRIRAVENGVPILRSCNTGVTCVIDCFGRPLAELPISEEKAGILYFSLPVRTYSTLYTLWGDAAILILSLGGLLFHFAFLKKKLP